MTEHDPEQDVNRNKNKGTGGPGSADTSAEQPAYTPLPRVSRYAYKSKRSTGIELGGSSTHYSTRTENSSQSKGTDDTPAQERTSARGKDYSREKNTSEERTPSRGRTSVKGRTSMKSRESARGHAPEKERISLKDRIPLKDKVAERDAAPVRKTVHKRSTASMPSNEDIANDKPVPNEEHVAPVPESKHVSVPEQGPEPEFVHEPESMSGSTLEPKPAPELKPELEIMSEPEPALEPETKPGSEPALEPETKPGSEPASGSEPEPALAGQSSTGSASVGEPSELAKAQDAVDVESRATGASSPDLELTEQAEGFIVEKEADIEEGSEPPASEPDGAQYQDLLEKELEFDESDLEIPTAPQGEAQVPSFKRESQAKKSHLPALPNGARIGVGIVAILLAIGIVCVLVGLGMNSGKVLKGVEVAGVDLSGLTQEEAAEKIESELGSRIAATTVQCVPTGEDQARLKAAYEAAGITDQEFTWTVNVETTGITLDADRLAEEAFAVGRPVPGGNIFESLGSIFGGRWKSFFGGTISLDPTTAVTYDEEKLDAVITTMNARLEIPMENWNVVTSGTDVVVHEGHDGWSIDGEALEDKFTWAFLLEGANTVSVGVPMMTVPYVIDQTKANECANHINASISAPVTLVYNDQVWEISPADLGQWTYTRVEGEGEDARLVAYIDPDVAVSGFVRYMGPQAYGNAVDATFDVSSGVPVVVPSIVGTGPDLTDGALLLSQMVYGDTRDGDSPNNGGETHYDASTRTLTIADAEKQPNITTEDAESYGINELIASYTLHYGYAEGTNREHNIELALDMLNGTLVAPGQTWSWVDDMGPCGYDEGFLAAGAIGEGGTSIQEAGGGICNVATCVFNVVYDAGLQIDERHNHSEYLENYPYGRDATVSYPGVTLTWTNDYASYLYITTSYDGYDMTINIWGTSEGRTVESNSSDFTNNAIYNWRTVRDASGNVIHEDTFYSYFRY